MNQNLSSVQNKINEEPLDPGFTISPDQEIGGIIDAAIGEIWGNRPGSGSSISLPVTVVPVSVGRPCFSCTSNQWMPAAVRFLNAAVNYNPFTIRVNNQTVQNSLAQGGITQYSRYNPGYYTVTVAGSNGYIYLQKQVYIGDGMITLAIINHSSGIDLLSISDTSCPTNSYSACIRVGNLAAYSGPINVSIGNLVFSSVDFREIASFSRVTAGTYTVNIARSAQPSNNLLSIPATLSAGRIYTLYIMNWNASLDAVQTLLVEDRRS